MRPVKEKNEATAWPRAKMAGGQGAAKPDFPASTSDGWL
jgi:hypothetical protein